MNKLTDKASRQKALLEAVETQALATQDEAAKALAKRGVAATQVSISRDIAELGIVKVGGRYRAALPKTQAQDPEFPLKAWAQEVLPAGPNLVVVKCGVGTAQRVGLALDQLGLPGLVGTLAGDDTVFCACSSSKEGAKLVAYLRSRMAPGA